MNFFLRLFQRRPRICPNCHPGSHFPHNAILRMCSKCTRLGYDYFMFFNLETQRSFLIVALKAPTPP